jgi:aspartate ammonia-lyase
MACFQVSGLDHAIALAAGGGELELNVMTPLLALDLATSFQLLTRAVHLLRTRCVDGLVVDRRRVAALVAGSLIEATALSPYLGYEVTAELVKEALASGRTFRDIVMARRLVDGRTLARLLHASHVTRPRRLDVALRRRLLGSEAYRAFRRRL